MIDPADTRAEIHAALSMLAGKRERLPRRRHDNTPPDLRTSGRSTSDEVREFGVPTGVETGTFISAPDTLDRA